MMIKRVNLYALLFLVVAFLTQCDGFNFFSVSDDKTLGAQVDDEIENSGDYNILSETDYPDAYAYLREIRDEVLMASELRYTQDFEWQVHIIQDDDTLNAFATPGGYLYFYSGLIKYLQSEDHFAGVMAHEIAHADRRHSTSALSRQFGISILLQVALGNDYEILQEIASGLTNLSFSRGDEAEADRYSVFYLNGSRYACDGAAGFFEQLINEGQGDQGPEFLSTHPNPDNRVDDIQSEADRQGCDTTPSGRDFASFQAMLP